MHYEYERESLVSVRITVDAFLRLQYYIEAAASEVSGLGQVRELPSAVETWDEEILERRTQSKKYGWGFHEEYNSAYWEKDELEEKEGGGKRSRGDDTRARTRRIFLITSVELFRQTASEAHATLSPDDLASFLTEKLKKKEDVSAYKVWWHSHCYMPSYFSITDLNTIQDSTEFPYLISLVGNKAGEYQVRYDSKTEETESDLPLLVLPADDLKLRAQCSKEVKEKVQKKFWGNYKDEKSYKKDEYYSSKKSRKYRYPIYY